jgi:hypothetical protein
LIKFPRIPFEVFIRYQWPGNFRELRNDVELAVIITGRTLQVPMEIFKATSVFNLANGSFTLKEAEKELILQTLAETEGDDWRSARNSHPAWPSTHKPDLQNAKARYSRSAGPLQSVLAIVVNPISAAGRGYRVVERRSIIKRPLALCFCQSEFHSHEL